MAMLRSAIRLAFRQSAPAPRFFGNVGRRNPASTITSKRNYFNSSEYDFVKEDFTDPWNAVDFLIGGFGFAIGLLFYHNLKTSRYNTAHYVQKSTSDTGHYGQEKAEKKELSEVSMSN
ncbi:uncharacterized protein LOC124671759 [Lolium rigidum]|uniref:uncharacterized protein LOC124671759 n=1 Tax=Lolium rigidum TaxID=89674 RepID=UPI001F5CD6F9|nr:uncharacterized protein LOC124671759 [Lolium rigidum]XP_051218065.1 uncharacterized protein LOC127335456 isoform X1 [Lolium perenne]